MLKPTVSFPGMCGINWGITDISKVFLMFILSPNMHEYKICLVLRAYCSLLFIRTTVMHTSVFKYAAFLCIEFDQYKLNFTAFTVFQSDNGLS